MKVLPMTDIAELCEGRVWPLHVEGCGPQQFVDRHRAVEDSLAKMEPEVLAESLAELRHRLVCGS